MKKKIIITYFLIFGALLAIMSISRPTSEKMRGNSIAFLTPLWERLLSIKHFIAHPSQPSPFTSHSIEEEMQRLQVENQLLATELTFLQRLFDEQMRLSTKLAMIASSGSEEISLLSSEQQKALQRILKQLNWRLKAIPARVIFRSFDTWNSSLWINIGNSINQTDQGTFIAINSPVVLGQAIVGVVDYVGEHQSKVRLISDSRLAPSVRASRGGEQELLISEYIEGLLQQLQRKKSPRLPSDHLKNLSELLEQLQRTLSATKKIMVSCKRRTYRHSFILSKGSTGKAERIWI